MVVISKHLMFNILESKYWNSALTKDIVFKFVKDLENKLQLSFIVSIDDKSVNILRAALFRLKTEGLRKKIKGGIQFRKFKEKLQESKYSWDVPVKGHCCDKSLQVCSALKAIEKNVIEYENVRRKTEQKLVQEKKVLEQKLEKCQEKLKQTEHFIDDPIKAGKENQSTGKKRKSFETCTPSHQSKRRQGEIQMCKKVLSCIENENCKVTGVILQRNGKQEILDLLENDDDLAECEKDNLYTLVYVLDTFNISQKAYHELSMLYKSMPRSSEINRFVTGLNSGFTIINTADGLGVQQSLIERLTHIVSQLSKDNPEMFSGGVDIKLSADGTLVGKRLHVVNVTFTILNERRCVSSEGNYPLCIVKTKESYDELSVAFTDLRREVESLKKLVINGREYDVTVYLGGDYKFLLLAVGIGHISSEYFCIYCKCSKKEKADFSKSWSLVDVNKGARMSYTSNLEASGSSKRKKGKQNTFSLCKPPLFPSIPPSKVVVDHLHLFLRITDKLFNLLISELRMLDNITEKSTFSTLDRAKIKHISALEHSLYLCGIDFHLNVNRDSNKLEYRDLTGPEKVMFFSKFQASDLLDDQEKAAHVQSLWDQFLIINALIKDLSPNSDEIQPVIESWCNTFKVVYQAKDVTPYMHILRFHVTELINIHGNILKFSQQGLEKFNDIMTKAYFRATNHNNLVALRQILERQNRLALTEQHKRKQEHIVVCSLCKQPNHNKTSCKA